MNNTSESKTGNVQPQLDGFTEKDVARAISSLAYRKAYNARADVKAARKERNARIALAMRYVREHPEVVTEMKGDRR